MKNPKMMTCMLKLNDTVWQQKLNLNDDCMLHWMLKEFLTWGAVEKVAEEYIINSGLSYEVSGDVSLNIIINLLWM